MTMRRTIGLSLAFLVISAGAIGKTPDKGTARQPAQPLAEKSDARVTPVRSGCDSASVHSSVHRTARGQYRPSEATPDSYLDPEHAAAQSEIGKAAWYALVGNYTSSGERLDTVTATAAHRTLPLASYAKVTNLDNGRSVIVKINDRGPQTRRFIIDLSPRAADEIDMRRAGVAAVIVEPVVFEQVLTEAGPTVAGLQSAGMPVAEQ